jgi:DNA-binding NarL/FixJ family response regulator
MRDAAVEPGEDGPADPVPGPEEHRQERVRVLVLDDEEIVYWGFRLLLAKQPWAERCLSARDGTTAIQLVESYAPHVALVDVGLADSDPDLFRRLLSAAPQLRILLLTRADLLPAATVRACGAAGYASRTWVARELVRAIRMASLGLEVNAAPPANQIGQLSARQQEILALIAAGKTNPEIASRLFLSRHTVKQHTSALYRKLNVRNRTHAVEAARRMGLISIT